MRCQFCVYDSGSVYVVLLSDECHEVVACQNCVNTLNERTKLASEIMCKESVTMAVLYSLLKESRCQNLPETAAKELVAD